MLNAKDKKGNLIEPIPNIKGYCCLCNNKVYSKCGNINIWHFAHYNDDCDKWSEGETDWHINWKLKVPKKNREVIVGKHRADIKLDNNLVVELQHSHLNINDIKEREKYYKYMIWIINCIPKVDNIIIRHKEKYITFKWKWARKSFLEAKCPIYLDLGKDIGLIKLKKIYDGMKYGWFKKGSDGRFYESEKQSYDTVLLPIEKIKPVSGWGYKYSHKEFDKKILKIEDVKNGI
jgi:hypothetical protein